MKRIGILGDICSGKSYIAKLFGYPVFNADTEVGQIYKKNKNVFKKLKKNLPLYFNTFPIKKNEVINAILDNEKNLKKIIKIVHFEVRKKMRFFLKKNHNKKIIILDIPLLLENKINKKNDILVFVHANKLEKMKRLRRRENFDMNMWNKFRKIQLPLALKKKKSRFIINNNFKQNSVKIKVKKILKEIL